MACLGSWQLSRLHHTAVPQSLTLFGASSSKLSGHRTHILTMALPTEASSEVHLLLEPQDTQHSWLPVASLTSNQTPYLENYFGLEL